MKKAKTSSLHFSKSREMGWQIGSSFFTASGRVRLKLTGNATCFVHSVSATPGHCQKGRWAFGLAALGVLMFDFHSGQRLL